MPEPQDLRRCERIPVNSVVWIEWDDPLAGRRHIRGRLADISCNGAKVIFHWPLSTGTPIRIGVPRLGFEGDAVVRRCAEDGDEFTLGLEFCHHTAQPSQSPPAAETTNRGDTSSLPPRWKRPTGSLLAAKGRSRRV